MATIITNSDVQKNIGQLTKNIGNTTYTVTNRWKPKMTILPYFDDNEDFINDYLEEYEIQKNKNKLKKEFKKSVDSGRSSLRI